MKVFIDSKTWGLHSHMRVLVKAFIDSKTGGLHSHMRVWVKAFTDIRDNAVRLSGIPYSGIRFENLNIFTISGACVSHNFFENLTGQMSIAECE
ncbi:hypothetical protein KP79_PYT13838 [Mizuhopecten yessoensis]|uniref:Uncharacterized protein n=1 Tax=Mizuhopecten yessoensis TaxID=6573 RepID=A0A210QQA5_MIZYE|nr:hypothetical protein KP79_PYT13838 [Mizuhopecten yessoensis]